MNFSKKRILYAFGLLLVIIFVWNLLSQTGVQDLPGNFQELAQVRNENNTGPVFRRYLVSVSDTLWPEMQQYGNLMPYTKLGVTEVYYFLDSSPFPEGIFLGEKPFDEAFDQQCVAKFQKNAMGEAGLQRFPFRP